MKEEIIYINIDAMPVSANQIWRQNYKTGRSYLNPEYQRFRTIVKYRTIGIKMPKSWKYCAVTIVVHPKRKAGDADNYNKGILDSLTKAGFWDDDSCVSEVRSAFGDVDKNGRVEIAVEERKNKFWGDLFKIFFNNA